MELKLNIPDAIARKAFCIILALLIGLNILAGGALAITCHGGADCLICAGSMNPRFPGMEMGMASDGCQPVAQNSSCGFEDSSGSDKFFAIISVVTPDKNEASGILSYISAEGPVHLAEKFPPQSIYFDTIPTTPIYLIIKSLLC
jgi:hypothetical protein